MPPLYSFINRATKRFSGRIRQSPYVVFSCGDSAGNVQFEMAKIVKKMKRKKQFIWVHFERDEIDVEKRAKKFRKFAWNKNVFCYKLRNKKTGLEFEKNLRKALDLIFDWSPKIEEALPYIVERISGRKSSYGIFIIGAGGHVLSSVYLAKRIIESHEFAHTTAVILEPEGHEKKCLEIYEKTVSYLDKSKIFETHIIVPSRSIDGNFREQDNQNVLSLLTNLQSNSPDNIAHLCSKTWWRLYTHTTINPFYKRWFRIRHHEDIPFEPLATTINAINNNGQIDETSVYSFAGDLRNEEVHDAFAKLSAQKRQKIVEGGKAKVETRQLVIKINKRNNVVVGRFVPVSVKKFVDDADFTELEFLMSRPQGKENEYYI